MTHHMPFTDIYPADPPLAPPAAPVAADIAGIRLLILAERALFWPDESLLVIADLHLGKSDIFRRHGIAVPHAVQRQDLQRLHRVLRQWRPRELVILGDFVHGCFLGEETLELWQALRHANATTRFILTRGNHDAHLKSEALLLDAVHERLQRQQVLLTHEPVIEQAPDFRLNIHGHIHPALRVAQLGRKLPCLAYAPPYLNLPAFSEFTGSGPFYREPRHAWLFPDSESPPIALF